MVDYRDHKPITIDEFNGLWRRGDDENVPLDHFSDGKNVQFFDGGFRTRDGLEPYDVSSDCINLSNVRRIHSYRSQGSSDSILVLDTLGNIYHSTSPTPCTPILSIPAMTDFSILAIGTKVYISPHDGTLGLENEFIYVYQGNGVPARKAAGAKPLGVLTGVESASVGIIEAGVHIYGVLYETDTGFLTAPAGFVAVTSTGGFKVDLSNIPVPPSIYVVKKHVVATRAINPTLFTGNLEGYQFFFVPDAELTPAQTTYSASFYDVELLDDASHLLDNLEEIPAAAAINRFSDRMVIGGIWGENNAEWVIVRVSEPGEPEAFNSVDGLFSVEADDYPITNLQEYRDALYIFKQIRTYAVQDNGNLPSTWKPITIDQGVGASIHGIAQVLDSGGINIEYLFTIDWSGVMIFGGTFSRPEFSYKIRDLWLGLSRTLFNKMQIVNSSIKQHLFIVLPDGSILHGDYSQGQSFDKVKWIPFSFDAFITTITLINTDTLILGALEEV